jgi:hypothetical protein
MPVPDYYIVLANPNFFNLKLLRRRLPARRKFAPGLGEFKRLFRIFLPRICESDFRRLEGSGGGACPKAR